MRGLSSAGRAVALQASGHRFDPDRLHHISRDEDISSGSAGYEVPLLRHLIFDIVNGFFDRCREASREVSNR